MSGGSDLRDIPNEHRPKIRQIRDEYGDLTTFIQKAQEWIQKVPPECLENQSGLKTIKKRLSQGRTINWSTTSLTAVHRRMTSVKHIEWIKSVLRRIDSIERLVERKNFPLVSVEVDTHDEEELNRIFQDHKKTALKFTDSVRTYIHNRMDVTEKQLDTLNSIYERFESI